MNLILDIQFAKRNIKLLFHIGKNQPELKTTLHSDACEVVFANGNVFYCDFDSNAVYQLQTEFKISNSRPPF